MIQFRLFGIPISVQPWFWLTMAFLGGIMHLSSVQDLIAIGLFVLAGFISILVHELGHALMVRYYKLPTEIVLQAFGGYATHPAGVLNRVQSFLVTLAGPLIQIVLGALVLYIYRSYDFPEQVKADFLWPLIWVSFVWALLNCLPVYPLDGGQMLSSILGPKRFGLTLKISIVVGIVLGIFALTNGYMLGAVFMGLFSYQNFQRLQQGH